jgi:hypothetical protein
MIRLPRHPVDVGFSTRYREQPVFEPMTIRTLLYHSRYFCDKSHERVFSCSEKISALFLSPFVNQYIDHPPIFDGFGTKSAQ